MLGLVFAGGGVSGAAHAGVLKAMIDAGIRVDCICGTSSGAIVAALYASGKNPADTSYWSPLIAKKPLDYDIKGILRKLWRRRTYLGGVMRGDKLQHALNELLGDAQLTELQPAVGLIATDLASSREIVFASRPLLYPLPHVTVVTDERVAMAVRASLSIPGLFQPLRRDNRVLVDGGVTDNCPIEVARAFGATHIIAVDTITPFAQMQNVDLESAPGIISRVINITLASHVAAQASKADLLIHPNVGFVGALEWKAIPRCIEEGYKAAKSNWASIVSVAKAAGAMPTPR